MAKSKAQRAIEALREAAAAYRELPDAFKRKNIWTGIPHVDADKLEQEADILENWLDAARAATEET